MYKTHKESGGTASMILRVVIVCWAMCGWLSLETPVGVAQTTDLQSGQQKDANTVTEFEFQEELSRIRSLAMARDLAGLEEIGDAIEKEWEKWQGDHYFRLMNALSDHFGSYDFGKPRRERELEEKYARLAFQKPGVMPLEVELSLTRRLGVDHEYLDYHRGILRGEAWAQVRADKIKRWFQAWSCIEKEIDDDFDFEDVPQVNVSLPEGVVGVSGGDPKHIQDPAKRAEYEAAIERNAKKAEKYSEQYRLRQLERSFSSMAERYMTTAYSRPPFDLKELERYLDAHVAVKPESSKLQERKNRILEVVRQEMQRQGTQSSQPAGDLLHE